MEYRRSPRDRRRIGDILRDVAPDVSPDRIESADVEKKEGERLGECLVRTGEVDPEDLARSLSKQTGFPYLALSARDVDRESLDLVPRTLQVERRLLVLQREDDGRALWIAMVDPRDSRSALDVESRTGLSPRIWVVSEHRMEAVQAQVFAGTSRIRYRLLVDVPATMRVGAGPAAGPEVEVRIRDASLSGIQLELVRPPADFVEDLQARERELDIQLAFGRESFELATMLAWIREESGATTIGFEFFDRSKEDARRLYRILLYKGEHQVSRPPKPSS